MFETDISAEIREKVENNRVQNIKTLFDLPYGTAPANADYCILGAPYDSGAVDRPGSRFGPAAIRSAYGAQRLAYEQDNAYKTDNLRGVDLGDVGLVSGYALESMQLIYEKVKQILDAGAIPVVLGGGRLVSYPELRAYSERYGRVAVIHFGANAWVAESAPVSDATALANAAADGLVDCGHSVQLGPRCAASASQASVDILTSRQIHRLGLQDCCRRIRSKVGNAKVFVSFDIGFLDPVYAPGADAPVPGGCSVYEACELLRGLEGLNFVGFDLTGVLQTHDPGGITAIQAVAVIKQFLILLSRRKAGKKGEAGDAV